MVPFTPRLIPAILPNLAHHVHAIQSAALQTNSNLFSVIESLPSPPSTQPLTSQPSVTVNASGASSVRTTPGSPPLFSDLQSLPFPRSAVQTDTKLDASTPTQSRSQIPLPADDRGQSAARPKPRERPPPSSEVSPPGETASRPQSPNANLKLAASTATTTTSQQNTATSNVATLTTIWQQSQAQGGGYASEAPPAEVPNPFAFSADEPDPDPFDYQATVSGLMVQFLSEYVETRVEALKWLLMLHQKAPKKVFCRVKVYPLAFK